MTPNQNSPAKSELRKDYYRDRYVIIAPLRNLRPDSFMKDTEPHKIPDPNCHLCNNLEPALYSIPSGRDWQVKVIANKYPALTLTNPKAFGAQEVVINTPRHDQEFSELTIPQILEVFAAYRHRLIALRQIPGIRYVLVFKNDGPMAGASVAHAHCQIIALPMIPPHIESESNALVRYQDAHNSCAHCDIIAWEEKQKVRIVFADKHFVAISPYAASAGFGLWIMPRQHRRLFTDLNASELKSLAVILKKVTSRLDNNNLSFNYFLQESIPFHDHHLVLKVEPRTFKWAGAELGTGVIINAIPPEYAALWYNGKI
jgi:UDPglucose--hexose-1-phosphate uridylyltransferase